MRIKPIRKYSPIMAMDPSDVLLCWRECLLGDVLQSLQLKGLRNPRRYSPEKSSIDLEPGVSYCPAHSFAEHYFGTLNWFDEEDPHKTHCLTTLRDFHVVLSRAFLSQYDWPFSSPGEFDES
jgi:hypothetical protein